MAHLTRQADLSSFSVVSVAVAVARAADKRAGTVEPAAGVTMAGFLGLLLRRELVEEAVLKLGCHLPAQRLVPALVPVYELALFAAIMPRFALGAELAARPVADAARLFQDGRAAGPSWCAGSARCA